MNRPAGEEQAEGQHDPQVLTVEPGESIQSVIDQARAGDTVQIPFGVYTESLILDEPDIRLMGLPNAEGTYPVLDGTGTLANGVIASGDGFKMAFMELKGYTDTAVQVKDARNIHLHDLTLSGPGTFGISLELCSEAMVNNVRVTGMSSSGVYAGSSEKVHFTSLEAFGNAIGIELGNSINSEIRTSHAYENAVGVFIALQPHLSSKISLNNQVVDNVIENNNTEDVQDQKLPRGTGVIVLAADHVELKGNTIRDHSNAGLAVYSLTGDFADNKIDVGIYPEHLSTHDNLYAGNKLDVIWDGKGVGNAFDDQAASSSPWVLPSSRWSEPIYRLYWRVLNLFS